MSHQLQVNTDYQALHCQLGSCFLFPHRKGRRINTVIMYAVLRGSFILCSCFSARGKADNIHICTLIAQSNARDEGLYCRQLLTGTIHNMQTHRVNGIQLSKW